MEHASSTTTTQNYNKYAASIDERQEMDGEGACEVVAS
jgi:hypothetical protein